MARSASEPPVPQPVTVTIARRVAPGREADFEEWSGELTAAASRFDGYLGAGMLRPSRVGEPWHVVFRFDSGAHLHEWDVSAERAAMLARGEDLVHSSDVHRVTGLETRFALPGRTAPAPDATCGATAAGLALRPEPPLLTAGH